MNVSLYIPSISDGLDGNSNNNHLFLWRKLTWVKICTIIFAVVFIKLIVSHIAVTLVQTLMAKRKTQKSRCQSSVVWTYENVFLYERVNDHLQKKRNIRDENILKKNFNQTRETSSRQYLLFILLITLWG